MKKYKLIKEYPGSPTLGQIALPYTDSKNQIVHYIVERNKKKDCDFIALKIDWIENQPEYWEEVKDNIYWLVLTKEYCSLETWKPIKVEAIALDTDNRKYFSTEEDAKTFILFHKPCLSYNDVKEEIHCGESRYDTLNNIYNIVKEKI